MTDPELYPLRFEPIFQYRLWGGRRLGNLLSAPLPGDGPIGEAWLLSDRDDHQSLVADGPLKGWTIGQVLGRYPEQVLGKRVRRFRRFPLLLKFLDACDTLSVQVHPSDRQSKHLPEGETGKTEAWVVLDAGPRSRIYAGLRPGATAEGLRQAIASGTVADQLASFRPGLGVGILVPAGTVHTMSEVVVFEVQQNSDVTFRLYDWDRMDPRTGHRRELQVEQAMACLTWPQEAVGPAVPVEEGAGRERLVRCEQFGLWRLRGGSPFMVGEAGAPQVLVCIAGEGRLSQGGAEVAFGMGDVLLLPASVGLCSCRPLGGAVCLLAMTLPEGA